MYRCWITVLFGFLSCSAAVAQIAATGISILPGSTSKCINVISTFPMEQIEVFELNGSRKMTCRSAKGTEAQLDLSLMDPGIYLVRVRAGDLQTITKKIVVVP